MAASHLRSRLGGRRVLARLAAAAAAGTALLVPTGAATASTWVVLTTGTNAHSRIPITVTLPAPSDGSSVTSVRYRWETWAAPWNQMPDPTFSDSYVVDTTSLCVSGEPCTVEADVPTASMPNGTVNVSMAAVSGTTTLYTGSATITVQNPKPTVTASWPTFAAEWGVDGPTSLAFTPTPSSGGARIARTLLYLDPGSAADQPIAVADAASTEFSLDASTFGPVGSGHGLYIVTQDAEGNYSRPITEKVLVAPGPQVSPTLADGDLAGDTFDLPIGLTVAAQVPDGFTQSTEEHDPYTGYAISMPAGIKSMALSVDGGPETTVPWEPWMTPGVQTPPREWAYTFQDSRLTAGTHTVRYTARTTYGATTSVTRTVRVSDGAAFGDVTDGSGRVVADRKIVPVGSPLTLQVDAHTTGSSLSAAGTAGLGDGATTGLSDGGFHISGTFFATRPGSYPVYFWATSPDSGSFDPNNLDPRREIERTVVVEHHVRAALTGATKPLASRPRGIYGRVVDTATGRGVGGVRALLQRRQSGRWVTVTHSWTADHGRVEFGVRRQRPARYRLVVPHRLGLVMAATGQPRRL